MTLINQTLAAARVSDPVVTQVVHGYMQANSIANFVAPVVPVQTRSGKVVKFTKEAMAVRDTRRTRGSRIRRVGVTYDYDRYELQQHAQSGAVTEEDYQEALNGAAKIDLRANSAIMAAEAIAQSWENEVITTITNSTLYEPSCLETLSGTAQFSDPGSNPLVTVESWKEAVRAQIGIYPNSAVISTDVYNALKFHPDFRDQLKYTSPGSVTLVMLAEWLGLPGGIRVSQRLKLDPASGNLVDMLPGGTFITFYNPTVAQIGDAGEAGTVFTPLNGADRAKPSFAYTYQLQDQPVAFPERFDEDTRVYLTDVIAEQSIQLTYLGSTGKAAGGFYADAVVA